MLIQLISSSHLAWMRKQSFIIAKKHIQNYTTRERGEEGVFWFLGPPSRFLPSIKMLALRQNSLITESIRKYVQNVLTTCGEWMPACMDVGRMLSEQQSCELTGHGCWPHVEWAAIFQTHRAHTLWTVNKGALKLGEEGGLGAFAGTFFVLCAWAQKQ